MLESKIINHIIGFCHARRERDFDDFSLNIDREFCSMVYCLTQHDGFVAEVNRRPFITWVCQLIESFDTCTRREICRALTNLAESPVTRKCFLKQENLDGLLLALKYADMDVFHSVALAFGYIFSTDEVSYRSDLM